MKNQKHTLKATPRKLLKSKVKSLRKEGIVPANIFGKDIKSQAIQIDQKEFKKVFDEAGETSLIELVVGSSKKPVLVSNTQSHPVSDELLHIDFRQVNLKEKVTATVPFMITGESPAEKGGLGNVVQQLTEIDVEALPTDLPEEFVVDISSLAEVDQSIAIKDLKFDKSKLTIGADPDQIIIKVEALQKEEEVAPPPTEDTEAEDGEEATEEKTEDSEATPEAPKEE